jgi:hypothetical protein
MPTFAGVIQKIVIYGNGNNKRVTETKVHRVQ